MKKLSLTLLVPDFGGYANGRANSGCKQRHHVHVPVRSPLQLADVAGGSLCTIPDRRSRRRTKRTSRLNIAEWIRDVGGADSISCSPGISH